MTYPGDAEWLRTISDISRVRDLDAATGDNESLEVAVLAEVSMRFRLLSRRVAHKAVDTARTTAKEQRRSASNKRLRVAVTARHGARRPPIISWADYAAVTG